jgi:hypothetical protein
MQYIVMAVPLSELLKQYPRKMRSLLHEPVLYRHMWNGEVHHVPRVKQVSKADTPLFDDRFVTQRQWDAHKRGERRLERSLSKNISPLFSIVDASVYTTDDEEERAVHAAEQLYWNICENAHAFHEQSTVDRACKKSIPRYRAGKKKFSL